MRGPYPFRPISMRRGAALTAVRIRTAPPYALATPASKASNAATMNSMQASGSNAVASITRW